MLTYTILLYGCHRDGKALIGGCTMLLLLLAGLVAMTTWQGLERGDAQQRGDFTQHFTGFVTHVHPTENTFLLHHSCGFYPPQC